MIYIGNVEFRTAKSAGYLGNAGVKAFPALQPYHNTQCFPLKFYGHASRDEEVEADLFSATTEMQLGGQRDGITDAGLKHFKDAYPGETITKEDLFYYVYGLLHSEDYRAKYADNLSKELPRIPRVKTAADFWAFSRAGRELGDLHVNYETVERYPVTIKQGDLRLADIKNPEAFYRVTKWTFGKNGKDKDKTTVIYNANITMQDIPLGPTTWCANCACLRAVLDAACRRAAPKKCTFTATACRRAVRTAAAKNRAGASACATIVNDPARNDPARLNRPDLLRKFRAAATPSQSIRLGAFT